MKVRAHIYVNGRVQGVFYRSATRSIALSNDVKGWVQNLSDGKVEAIFEGKVYRPAIVIANKADHPKVKEKLKKLKNIVDDEMPVITTSCVTKEGIEELGAKIFEMLNIIRVYTKEPNKKNFSKRPFTIKKGSTIFERVDEANHIIICIMDYKYCLE